jgi:prepilin-type N-terminal cleavage/methylation domain-containing protein
MKQFKSKAQGFSLLELLLVVAVGAVLILAGLGAYRLVSDNNNANAATRQVQSLKTAVQGMYQGQSSYGAAKAKLTDVLIDANAAPSDMITSSTTTLRSAFGTDVTVAAIGTAPPSFGVTFAGVPKNACTKLGMLYSTVNSSDFVNVQINGKTAITAPTPALLTGTNGCTAATNTMIFQFR